MTTSRPQLGDCHADAGWPADHTMVGMSGGATDAATRHLLAGCLPACLPCDPACPCLYTLIDAYIHTSMMHTYVHTLPQHGRISRACGRAIAVTKAELLNEAWHVLAGERMSLTTSVVFRKVVLLRLCGPA